MLLAQSAEIVEGAAKVLENRSESTLLVVIVIALVAGIYYLQYRDNVLKAERQDKREQLREERDAAKARTDSESLMKIAEGMLKCGDASQQFAGIARSLESTIENHHAETKRAMWYAFKSIEHFIQGNSDEARHSILAGKAILEERRSRPNEN